MRFETLLVVISKMQVKRSISETKKKVQWIIKLIFIFLRNIWFLHKWGRLFWAAFSFQVPCHFYFYFYFLGLSKSLVARQPYVGQVGQHIFMHRTVRKSKQVGFPLVRIFILRAAISNTTLGGVNNRNLFSQVLETRSPSSRC